MGAPQTDRVRNLVLVGQGGVGKTSLAEAMLHLSGKTARLGGHAGSKPTLDYDPEESKRNFSISTSIAPIEHNGLKINILDAPCYPDFIGDAYAALSVAETAPVVVDAAEGPQATTVKLWYAAEDLPWPRPSSSTASTASTPTSTRPWSCSRSASATAWRHEPAHGRGRRLPRRHRRAAHEGAPLRGRQGERRRTSPPSTPRPPRRPTSTSATWWSRSTTSLMEKYLEGTPLEQDELESLLGKAIAQRLFVPVLRGLGRARAGHHAAARRRRHLLPLAARLRRDAPVRRHDAQDLLCRRASRGLRVQDAVRPHGRPPVVPQGARGHVGALDRAHLRAHPEARAPRSPVPDVRP